jgi:hypothetical protein
VKDSTAEAPNRGIVMDQIGREPGMPTEPDLTTPEGRNMWLSEVRANTHTLPRSERKAARRQAMQPVYGTPSYGTILIIGWTLIVILLADLIWYTTSGSGPLWYLAVIAIVLVALFSLRVVRNTRLHLKAKNHK